MSASVRSLHGEKPEMYEIAVSANEGQTYAKLLKKASKLVRQLDPDGCHIIGMHWSESRDSIILTLVASHTHRKCEHCGHRDPHTAGGLGVCYHAGCGCDG